LEAHQKLLTLSPTVSEQKYTSLFSMTVKETLK
jgi:hypothetical protein